MSLPETGVEREAVHTVMHRLETRWLPDQPPDTTVYHAWHPLPYWLFLDGIRPAIEATEGKRFLDVGCGLGTKLAIMHQLGYEVHGIERHEPYVTAAKELLNEQAANITHADAFDIPNFDADIVYMYRPGKTDEIEETLERHVADHVAAGTVLYFPERANSPACAGFEQITPDVWKVP